MEFDLTGKVTLLCNEHGDLVGVPNRRIKCGEKVVSPHVALGESGLDRIDVTAV
jgi:hypothetical protein